MFIYFIFNSNTARELRYVLNMFMMYVYYFLDFSSF